MKSIVTNMRFTHSIAILAALAFIPEVASAEKVDFTYNYYGSAPVKYPKESKPETIDVAIFLDGNMFEGASVSSMSVPLMCATDCVSDFKAFMTTELKTRTVGGTRHNDPDICSIEATVSGGVLYAEFPKEYTVTKNGVYVGYSMEVTTQGDWNPIAVVSGDSPGSFYYHATSSQIKWKDMVTYEALSSAIAVTLNGVFPDNSASLSIPEKVYAGKDDEILADVTVTNCGLMPMKSISYSYEYAGVSGKSEYELTEELPNVFGMPYKIKLPLGIASSLGESALKVTIDGVNGSWNNNGLRSAEGNIEVLKFLPHNRPLVEEYTGLDCGWCPKGYVMMKEMTAKYGHEEFVAMAYHAASFERGAMVCLKELPYSPASFPASQVNRTNSPSVENVPSVWSAARDRIPEGEIEVSLDWADEQKSVLKAVASCRFLNDSNDSDYRISFALVADGLSNPEWSQYNIFHYTDDYDFSDLTGPLWDLFVGKDMEVYGLTFDDVAVYYPDMFGIDGSLPAEIVSCEYYTSEFTVNTSDVVNIKGEHIVEDFGKTRVIAMILDAKTGAVINSASSPYPGNSGVAETITEKAPVSVSYHNLQGQRIAKPSKGIYIKTEHFNDGSSASSKVLF